MEAIKKAWKFKKFLKSGNIDEVLQATNEPVINITEGQPQSKTTAKYLNLFLSMYTSISNYKNI